MPPFVERYFSPKYMLKKVPVRGEIPPVSALLARTDSIVWPAVIESVLLGLVGMIDTVMVGTLGTVSLSAVGLTAQPKYISLCPFFAMNVAVSALVARRRGEGDRENANRIMHQSIIITLVLTALISVIGWLAASPIIDFCGAQPDTHQQAVDYFRIVTAGLGFNTLSMVINAAQRGAGNTKIAMRTNVASNLVNIFFNYLLIGGNLGFPKLGVSGAAIATVLGTIVALIMSVLSVRAPEGFLHLQLRQLGSVDKKNFNSLVKMGSGAFVEQICMRVGFLLFAMIVAKLGTRDFAVHNICMNVMNFVFFFGEGLSTAAVTLVGQSLGQKRPDLARIYAGICQRLGFIMSVVLAAILIGFAPQIVGMFSTDPTIIQDGAQILYMMIYCVLMQICMVVYCGCLRGAGDIRYVALIGLVSVSIVRPICSWVLCWPLGYGLIGAWVGFAMDQTCRFLMSWLRFRAGKWTRIRL
ncbi:MAG: MATE family efflux transporter [Pygmaiobacter massiliensis]|nr:MATE family efflux transporter [Pygmaiobacter massiliensis]